MATWSLTAPTDVFDDGNVLILHVRVVGLSFVPNEARSRVGDKNKIGRINSWRFNAVTGAVFPERNEDDNADGRVDGVDVYFVQEDQSTEGAYTFRVAISLQNNGRIALNADQGDEQPTKIHKLLAGWVTLKPETGSAFEDGPAMAHSQHGNLGFDPSNVGRLPSSNLQVHLSAHAENVKRGQVTLPFSLNSWENLAPSGEAFSGEPSSSKPVLDDPDFNNRPAVVFDGASDPSRFKTDDTPPAITSKVIAAAVIKPVSTTEVGTIAGRYNSTNGTDDLSWRFHHHLDDAGNPVITYDARTASGDESAEVNPPPGVAFACFHNFGSGGDQSGFTFWINGRVGDSGSMDQVQAGGGPLSVGARLTGTSAWGDAFAGQVNEVALYTSQGDQTDHRFISLVMHHISYRALLEVGQPVPAGLSQKYLDSNTPSQRRLDRKPIAVINLLGHHEGGDVRARTGQRPEWRNSSQTAIEDWLRSEIRGILNACDDFEIMFNRPGGTLSEDYVPSYIFAKVADFETEDTVTSTMWTALSNIWTEFKLHDHNNRDGLSFEHADWSRRAWFYTGGGLPLDSDAGLVTDGRMFKRTVAPVLAHGYRTDILSHWPEQDPTFQERYRCLFCDAMAQVYPKFVDLVQDPLIYEEFTLVGESIPPDENARSGAPWFSRLEAARSPWWNLDPQGSPDRAQGYNTLWTSQWQTKPTYFGVQDNEYPYLHQPPSVPPPVGWSVGPGSNMSMEDVYRFILKGGTPIAWPRVCKKIGAAWNYATGRVPLNTWDRTGRHSRVQR